MCLEHIITIINCTVNVEYSYYLTSLIDGLNILVLHNWTPVFLYYEAYKNTDNMINNAETIQKGHMGAVI